MSDSKSRILIADDDINMRNNLSDCPTYRVGDLTISLARYEVTRQGQPISLAKLEFELLIYLAQYQDQVISCRELLNQVWGYPMGTGDPAQVRNAIRRLRKKLGDNASHPRYIFTVRKIGYRFATPMNSAPYKRQGTN